MRSGQKVRGQRTALVVEDEFLIALDLTYMLEDMGIEVLGPAPSVGAALDLLEQTRPDIAIIDVNLGGEFSAPVAAALEARGVPFLIVTGYGEADLRHAELARAPRLAKPVAPRRLNEEVRRLLDRPNEASSSNGTSGAAPGALAFYS